MPLPLTTLFIGIFTLMQILLTARVITRRWAARVSLLDGGDKILTGRMRAHGNFTEIVPITLLAMAASELSGMPAAVLLPGGLCLLVGRLLHAYALSAAAHLNFRIAGMVTTLLPMAGFGAWALVRGLGQLSSSITA